MRRIVPLVLACCFLGLGTGVLRYAHEAAHLREDVRAQLAAADHPPAVPCEPHDHEGGGHDESNCDLHARLSAPLASTHVVPLLVFVGFFVAFLTLLPTPVARLRLPGRIDCRGPPSCPR